MVILEKTNIEREECQHKFPIVHGHCVVGGAVNVVFLESVLLIKKFKSFQQAF